jgi:phosphoribosylanthranilate isomerase
MVKIKICGITNPEDYNNVVDLNVDFLGFIFFKGSKRFIHPVRARQIIRNGAANNCRKVGVFVNEKIDVIKITNDLVGLDVIQLHGDESPDYCNELDLPYWKVIRIKDRNSINSIYEYDCNTFLLDTYSNNEYGGTGSVFDKSIAAEAIGTGKKIIIAGGVSIKNVKSIIGLSPFGVDINSSVEQEPGKKDKNKMKRIIETIKNMGN